MFYLQVSLNRRQVNSAPFMIAHMSANPRCTISFGGSITSLAHAIGLDDNLANLVPLPHRIIKTKRNVDITLWFIIMSWRVLFCLGIYVLAYD